MYDYEEVCPISRAASVLCERWTLQIIREIFFGASRFSEFQKYLPKVSPTLLNARLKTLVDQGIVVRKRIPEKRGFEYRLTAAGQSLKPLLTEFGKWGIQWVFDEMDEEQLNVSVLVRDFAAVLNVGQLPSGDSTIQLSIKTPSGPICEYILVRDGSTQTCSDNIGTEVDVYINTDIATLGKVWFGEISINLVQNKKLLNVVGSRYYTDHINRWLVTSQFAASNPKRQST